MQKKFRTWVLYFLWRHTYTFYDHILFITSGESWEVVIMGEGLTCSGIGSGWETEAKLDMVGGERLGFNISLLLFYRCSG